MKFKKRDEFIDALRFTGENAEEIKVWGKIVSGEEPPIRKSEDTTDLMIYTLGGGAPASPGHWVTFDDVTGNFNCYSNEAFERMFEGVDD